MIAPNDTPKTFRVKVKRQDTADSAPYWETFDVAYKPSMNVISVLQAIAANPTTVEGKATTPPVYLSACLEEVCGSCTAVVNGQVCQMCSRLVDDLIGEGGDVVIEPMTKFPVVRDLVVDRQRMFDNLEKINGWVPIDGTTSLGPGPKEDQDNQDVRYNLSRCMTCGCCLEVCPQFTKDNAFVGAQIISQVRYFNRHDTGAQLAGERLDTMMEPGGVADCGNAQNCVKICPKEIPLTESIAEVGRKTTWHGVKKFFTGK